MLNNETRGFIDSGEKITMQKVIYVEGKMEFINDEPKWIEKEFPAILEVVQDDGTAMIYIDTIPHLVSTRKLKYLNGQQVR
ncbi:hypothetical protein BSK59_13210 [Paenibacillus odorifer]|uniref:hypothetical protein n=1 Tax=Paenibacillus odorifer TaxID=189426 RepID=UPI00097B8829|nr:hypothetical protein [Paenibacillus odorifer]OME55431.1 hypothetical protein BSK59_13210 [Paenibacillus odorifer]